MGWDQGRYYTRSRKVGGRVVREYVGAGILGEAAALLDADRRALREAERQAWHEEKARLQALDGPVLALDELADLLARAALTAAGYHRHKAGSGGESGEANRDRSGWPGCGDLKPMAQHLRKDRRRGYFRAGRWPGLMLVTQRREHGQRNCGQ
jgi:hypothetical protein